MSYLSLSHESWKRKVPQHKKTESRIENKYGEEENLVFSCLPPLLSAIKENSDTMQTLMRKDHVEKQSADQL